jgi:tellurium resistance protein TerD
MSIKLVKDQRVDLTKGTNIKKIKVCLGWKEKDLNGNDIDLDTSAFVLNLQDKVEKDEDVVFYNQMIHPSNAIKHSGDDRKGSGSITHSDDKEIVTLELDKIPSYSNKIVFVASIYEVPPLKQKFGSVKNAFIRIIDADTNSELMRYDLTEDYSTATAVKAGEIYRNKGEWKFAADTKAFDDGLLGFMKLYGVNVA